MKTKRAISPEELRAELARRSWPQKRLAKEAGVSPSLIALICRGWRPSSRVAHQILKALGTEAALRVCSKGGVK